MYTYQQRLEYAQRLQQLQKAVVIKDNIHLTYKYKNRNKAYAHINSVQDRINRALIEDAVTGNGESIRNLDKQGEKLIHDTLTNERKRLHQDKKHKAVNQATKSNSKYFTNIFNYRRSKIGENFEDKLEKELRKNKYLDLSDTEKINQLTNDFGDYGKKRLKNIITDAMHTNEANIGFIKAIEDGYNYKIWKNGRVAKGRTRVWHKEKFISAVPIDETFDIYGSYPAHMMYPGDLNGGAENVANCRCWLNYTNRIPSNLRKKTVFNVSPTFQEIWGKTNTPINKLKTTIKKPIQKLKRTFSNTKNVISNKLKLPKDSFEMLTPSRGIQSKNSRIIDKTNVNLTHNPNKKILNDESFKKYFSLIEEHAINTMGKSNEWLTLISKRGTVLVKATKGVEGHVNIPKRWKKSYFHMTIHNHDNGVIMPSVKDLKTNIKHKSSFCVITSNNKVGVIKFGSKLTNNNKKIIISQYSLLRENMTRQFELNYGKKVRELSDEEYNKFFAEFISENTDRYINEFNSRLKEYNVEMTYINMR